jgi:hypothetical protein
MREVIALYGLESGINVFVVQYNSQFFEDSKEVLEHTTYFWNDFIEHRQRGLGLDLLDFINHSVKSNNGIDDFIVSKKFSVNYEENKISTKEEDGIYSSILLGEVEFENYKIFVSHQYLFIRNTSDKKSYMYYLD